MKVVKVLDHRRTYQKDGVDMPSMSYRLYDDNGHWLSIKPNFDKSARDWYSLSYMASETIEIKADEQNAK